jgi:hypothetical protein
MRCVHCGYEWVTKAKTVLVTCSSCGKKTKNLTLDLSALPIGYKGKQKVRREHE